MDDGLFETSLTSQTSLISGTRKGNVSFSDPRSLYLSSEGARNGRDSDNEHKRWDRQAIHVWLFWCVGSCGADRGGSWWSAPGKSDGLGTN